MASDIGAKRAGLRATAAIILVVVAVAGCREAASPILPAVPRGAFAGTWRDGTVVLVGIGDSITDGYGASEGRSYFDMLVANPPGDAPEMDGVSLGAVFPGLRAHNISQSYSTSIEHLSYQVEKMADFGEGMFGVIVITSGGNDVIHDYGATPPRDGAMYGATLSQARKWIAAYETRLAAILDGVTARFPGGCEIFLANIYDPTDGVGDIENAGLPLPVWKDGRVILGEMNGAIARAAAARKNVHMVDIESAFLGHGIHARDRRNAHYHADDPSYWYYENLEDPNDTGYDAIRRLFLVEMAKVFAPADEASAE